MSAKNAKKTHEFHILIPGSEGWEVWKQPAEGEPERVLENGPRKVIEIEDLPGGELVLLFPVRGFQALPFRVNSTDKDLFEDLAVMHAERLGIRADPMAGQLSDSFLVAQDEETSVLLHAVLLKPGEGELPLRTPNEFDLSARAYPVDGDAIAVWKELGRWVFAIFAGGKLIYSQATSSSGSEPDASLLREIRLALSQLALQGLRIEPDHLHLWSPQGELGELGALAGGFPGLDPVVSVRPLPKVPQPISRLLPEDVRAARLARQHGQRRKSLIGLAALAYLGLVGWYAWGYWKDYRLDKRLSAEVAVVDEVVTEYEEHVGRWDELAPVVDDERSPLEIMLHIGSAIPRESGVRLENVEINQNEIRIKGAAPESTQVTQFVLNLKRSADLRWIEWPAVAPNNTAKGWEFLFTGTRPGI